MVAFGSVSKTFLEELSEKQERFEKEEAERIAREKAEWDALPEEEKNRILTLRH
jgi:hypothetical protein